MKTYDAIVIGAGHNGLVAAAYLARAGFSVAVLERRDVVGGAAVSEPVWPGYTVSVGSYVCSLLDPGIVSDLRLQDYGYEAYRKEPASFTPLLDGRSLLLGCGDAADAAEIAGFNPQDSAGYVRFCELASQLGSAVADTFLDPDPRFADFPDRTRATLEGTVAELVQSCVKTPALQATLATDGLIGTFAGPFDRGTGYVFAHHYAGRALGVQGAWGFVRGGMGAISNALAGAARAAGAEIFTGAPVSEIAVRDGRAAGARLNDGREFRAACVLSNADPKTTFLHLLANDALPPELRERAQDWSSNGCSFKLNLALGALPDFAARSGRHMQAHHRATLHIAPSLEYLQIACDDARDSGASRAPMLECFMQTPTDPSLAPPGKHILSIFAQYFPYERCDGPWTSGLREHTADAIVATLAQYAPNLPDVIEARQILAAPDLEARFGMSGGQIFHGELLPGQIFEDRFAVKTPLAGLYLCGSGTHPGGCVSGFPGRRAAAAVLRESAIPA